MQRPINVWRRLGVGVFAGVAIPFFKFYQNGVDLSPPYFLALLGVLTPAFAMGALMGLYAVLVENEETSLPRLFRVCLAMPALVASIGGGLTAEARAEPSFKLQCTPKSSFEQGITQSVGAISNVRPARYLVLAKERRTNQFVVFEGERHYVVGRSTNKPESGVYYDLWNCKVEGVPSAE